LFGFRNKWQANGLDKELHTKTREYFWSGSQADQGAGVGLALCESRRDSFGGISVGSGPLIACKPVLTWVILVAHDACWSTNGLAGFYKRQRICAGSARGRGQLHVAAYRLLPHGGWGYSVLKRLNSVRRDFFSAACPFRLLPVNCVRTTGGEISPASLVSARESRAYRYSYAG